MGHDWRMAIQVLISVIIQITVAIAIRDSSWSKILFLAYVIGGTVNHTLSLALHELTHNLAFGHSKPICNRLLGFFANLPLGVPASITLKKYHLDHHRCECFFQIQMSVSFSDLFFCFQDFKVISSMIQIFRRE